MTKKKTDLPPISQKKKKNKFSQCFNTTYHVLDPVTRCYVNGKRDKIELTKIYTNSFLKNYFWVNINHMRSMRAACQLQKKLRLGYWWVVAF
jgi:hypothetical protein